MPFYGFLDKRIAQNLKRIGMNGVPSPSGKTKLPEVKDNGSRIYLAKPLETIPAATLAEGTLKPGSGTVEVYEILDVMESGGTTTNTTQARTNGEPTSLQRTAYNVRFSAIPGQSAAETTALYITVEDSFGRLLIVCDASADSDRELFACLESSISDGGSATAKVWGSDETLTVHASPLLCPGDEIDACTMVHVRWFDRYGKWYVVTVGGTCHCDCESGSDHSDSSDRSDQPDRSDSSSDSSSGGQTIYAKIWYVSECVLAGSHYSGDGSDSSSGGEWIDNYVTDIFMYAYVDDEGLPPSEDVVLYASLGTFNDWETARAAVDAYFSSNRQAIIDWGRGLLTCGDGEGTLWAQGYDIPWGTTLIDYDYTNGSGGE